MSRRLLSCAGVVAAGFLSSAVARAGQSVDFDFDDDSYLCEGQHLGGRAYVPDEVRGTTSVPILVFLHGINQGGPLHRWMGGGGDDVRAMLNDWIATDQVPPMVVAAPSQTCHAASGSTLWNGITLDRFIDSTERSLLGRAQLDRDRTVVAGHSGAGCNPSGGLQKIASDRGANAPLGIVAIDTCMDADVGEALARADEATRVAVFWQNMTWNRKVADFAIGFQVTRSAVEAGDIFTQLDPEGSYPHDAIVVPSLLAALRALLPLPITDQ